MAAECLLITVDSFKGTALVWFEVGGATFLNWL